MPAFVYITRMINSNLRYPFAVDAAAGESGTPFDLAAILLLFGSSSCCSTSSQYSSSMSTESLIDSSLQLMTVSTGSNSVPQAVSPLCLLITAEGHTCVAVGVRGEGKRENELLAPD